MKTIKTPHLHAAHSLSENEKNLNQQSFIARALASRDEAKRTGEYYSAESVLAELDKMLNKTDDYR